MPSMFYGYPPSFFVVHNHDANDHIVVIEVLDSRNVSIITETYVMESKTDISRKRPWKLRIPLSKGEFMIKIKVDNKIMETHHVELPHPYTVVDIRLYYEDYMGNVTPISVYVAPVV
ncbi:hypothetical protein HNV12_14550 [Methanococcoides sp. SA1]|nr:hypothetical protein [Methanococcoides sp. SA1]